MRRCMHSRTFASDTVAFSTGLFIHSKIGMHYYVLVALALVAAAVAAPQHPDEQPVVILRQESNVGVDGYHYYVETSDGTSRQEQGTLKQISEDTKALEVTGSYRYIAPDGLAYSVTYTANEHGFQPSEHVEHPGQGQQ